MWMWTVGYTVGDALYIAQTTADQRRAGWFSKVLWLLALACFLAYAVYQIYLCYDSYTNPDWSAGFELGSELQFPAVLMCPMIPSKRHRNMTIEFIRPSCLVSDEDGDLADPCATRHLIPTSGRFKGYNCTMFNGDINKMATATNAQHTFMETRVIIKGLNPNRHTVPFAVILFSPNEKNDHAENPTADSPNFVVVTDTSYWAVLSQQQDYYLDGLTDTTFYASISSSAALGTKDVITTVFSYSTFSVSYNYQIVTFDWLTLLGTLGGAAALSCAMHEIIMLLYSKIAQCCCGCGEEEKEEESDEGKEETKETKDEETAVQNGSSNWGRDIASQKGKRNGEKESLTQSLDLLNSCGGYRGSIIPPPVKRTFEQQRLLDSVDGVSSVDGDDDDDDADDPHPPQFSLN